jgi:hypothetical protein
MCVLVQRGTHPSRRSEPAGCTSACSPGQWGSLSSQPCSSEGLLGACDSVAAAPFHLREHLDKQEVRTFRTPVIREGARSLPAADITGAAPHAL